MINCIDFIDFSLLQKMAKQKDSRELAKDHMFQKRLKDRLTTYL